MTDQEISKLIHSHESKLRENILKTDEAKEIQKQIMDFMDKSIPLDSMPGLRYCKLKTDKRLCSWWSTTDGYPIGNPWSDHFEPILKILEQHLAEKTIKHRLESEGLFIESRSQGEDLHLLIGKRDDKGEKAHVVIDGKTAEVRVEDHQKEPTELVARVEAILTLPSGKKIKTSREAIEELAEEQKPDIEVIKIELDKEPGFNPIVTTKEGLAHSFTLTVPVLIKNLSDQKVSVRNIHAELVLPEGYQNGMFFTDLRNAEDLNGKDFIARTFLFRAEIVTGASGAVNDQNTIWIENKKKVLERLASTKITLDFRGERVSLNGTQPLSETFDITTALLPKLKK